MIAHFWQSVEGFFTFEDYYAWVVRELPSAPHCVEVGVYAGQSAAFLAVELANLAEGRWRAVFPDLPMPPERRPRLDLVDQFHGGNPIQNGKLEPVKHVIGQCHHCDSWDGAAMYEDRSLDFVFLDADHGYSSIKRDIAAWLPKVKPGGILGGHDYVPEFDGVCRSVSEAFPRWEMWRGTRRGDERMVATGYYYCCWSVRV